MWYEMKFEGLQSQAIQGLVDESQETESYGRSNGQKASRA